MGLIKQSILPLIFCICTIVYSGALLDYHHHSRFLIGSAVMAIACLYFGYLASNRRLLISLLDLVLLSFTGLNFLSILWAHDATEALFGAQKWLLVTSCYLVLRANFDETDRNLLVEHVSIVSQIFSGIILFVGGYDLAQILVEHGLNNDSLYDLKVMFGHKSLLSAFLFLLIPLNLLGGLPGQGLKKYMIVLLVLAQCLMVVLIQSRAVYIALVVLIIVLVLYAWKSRGARSQPFDKRIIVAAIGFASLLLVLIFANESLRQRFDFSSYFKSQTATERQLVWIKTKPLIADHLILGVGVGNWKILFPKYGVDGSYRMQDQNVFFTRAHNDFIEVLAETGLLGLLLYVMVFFLVCYRLYLFRSANLWQSSMLAVAFLGYLIFSLIDFPKERPSFLLLLGVYLGLIALLSPARELFALRENALRWSFVGLALALSFNVYVGFYRYQGEVHCRQLLAERVTKNWNEVLTHAKLSDNYWHHFDPSSVPIAYYRGLAYYNLGSKSDARTAFEEAHHRAPYNFQVLNNLATLDLEEDKYVEAIKLLKEALRINPRFEDALYNLAYAYSKQGKYKEAMMQVERIPKDGDKKELYRQEIQRMMDE